MEISKDLVAASATPLILTILSQGESYGYAIIQKVRELSGGEMHWTDGMLYPVLHRLERLGMIEANWQVARSGRKRKYYQILDSGANILAAHQAQWKMVHSTLAKMWEDEVAYA